MNEQMSADRFPKLDEFGVKDLQRLIDRCTEEIKRRKSKPKPVSENDVLLSLSSQFALHKRRKEKEKEELKALFR